MPDQERQKVTHLVILIYYTIFTIVLTGESILLGWEKEAVILLLIGFVISWVLHITGKFPETSRIWLYFVLSMLDIFFYGIHETSIYDLAGVMVVVIIMYSSAEMPSIINLCVVVYFSIMFYDFVFVLGDSMEFTPLSVSRTMLHLALVYMAGRLTKIIIRRKSEERKNTDDKIALLEETSRRTEDFLTNVSHELRTPINAVIGLTTVMLNNEEKESNRKNLLAIQMAGHRLFSQIEDILDYTEIDTGRIKVSEDVYMISSIVNDIISENPLQERENELELIFDIDAKIPSLLIGDGVKIKKIIKHLVYNAIKFTKNGGVYIRIYALPKNYGVNLCIKVSDTGIGIEEDKLEKIKEKFYQLNGGRNRRAGGLGLGIPIVYGMTAAMEGFMQIESTVENGTTVSVSIPQKVEDASPCMSVADKANLCLCSFFRHDKYTVLEVGSYYNEMISHMVCGLDLVLHRVSSIEELNELLSVYYLTHLFIGQEEYEENKAYFDGLDKSIEVVVVADTNFTPPKGSRIKYIRKPFCGLPVANILNAGPENNIDKFESEHMICPGVKVLVVDDEAMNLMVAEGILKDYGMQVRTADSGIKALEICAKEDFDLIFLDHMMPEMDGVETLKRLRKIHMDEGKTLTIIAFTANAVSGARDMFLQEGFDEFVSKPIEHLELERVLKKVLPKSLIKFVNKELKDNCHNDDNQAQDHTFTQDMTAENKNKNQATDDNFSYLENLGINANSGLQYCRGDREFYMELLKKFAQDAVRKIKEIDVFWHNEDLKNYHIMVHALKSSAKMIGADVLSEMARKAEEAAKNNDKAYILKYHEELLSKYHKIAQGLTPEQNKEPAAAESLNKKTELTKEEFLLKLSELIGSFDTFEADRAESLIKEIEGMSYQGMSVEGLLQDIREDIEEFEFMEASKKVQTIIDSMEGGKM